MTEVNKCAICWEEIGEKNKLVTSCGHTFHFSCISTNILKGNSNQSLNCPLCRELIVDKEFENWKLSFKKIALENNISEKTFDRVMSDTKFLSDVIKYDRYQPEFYEDTKTYISKRTSSKKVSLGKKFYEKNLTLINAVENEFNIERELLLALMGIETNFGTYVGKMDILSSLETLSFDKRRSEFFTNELLILLRLIENDQIDYKTLYGSWAGAFGFFQFMPSTMKNYAIDHDGNGYIDLKNNNFLFS